jgi:hypothetical protein
MASFPDNTQLILFGLPRNTMSSKRTIMQASPTNSSIAQRFPHPAQDTWQRFLLAHATFSSVMIAQSAWPLELPRAIPTRLFCITPTSCPPSALPLRHCLQVRDGDATGLQLRRWKLCLLYDESCAAPRIKIATHPSTCMLAYGSC